MSGSNSPRAFVGVTHYFPLTKPYFEAVLRASMEMASTEGDGGTILDFGCGFGRLSLLFPEKKVIGFDKIEELSSVSDWKSVQASVVIANHVFYCLDEHELLAFLAYWAERKVPLVFSDSLAGPVNQALAILLGQRGALNLLQRKPAETLSLAAPFYTLRSSRRVWALSKVFRLDPIGAG